jgi:hypothetical protein
VREKSPVLKEPHPFKLALEIDPGHFVSHWFLGISYVLKRMLSEARAEFVLAVPENCPSCGPAMEEPYILALLGEREKALEAIQKLPPGRGDWNRTAAFCALGEREQAFQAVWRILEDPDRYYSYNQLYLKVSALWDPLREDPRFPDLLRRLNFPNVER